MSKVAIVVNIFRHSANLPKLISSIREYKPNKLYIVSDGPKNYPVTNYNIIYNTR